MCLYYDHSLTQQQKARTEKFIAYKIYAVSGVYKLQREITSIYKYGLKSSIIQKSGTFESSDVVFFEIGGGKGYALENFDKKALDISGFHSFLTKDGAEEYMMCRFSKRLYLIIAVEIDPQDIVAAGLTIEKDPTSLTVVSSKITISPEEFSKIPIAPNLN